MLIFLQKQGTLRRVVVYTYLAREKVLLVIRKENTRHVNTTITAMVSSIFGMLLQDWTLNIPIVSTVAATV